MFYLEIVCEPVAPKDMHPKVNEPMNLVESEPVHPDVLEPKVVKWEDPVYIKDAEQSNSAVDHIITNPPEFAVVVCAGENLDKATSSIRMIAILANPKIYLYHLPDENKSLVKEGKLDELLKSQNCPKVCS